MLLPVLLIRELRQTQRNHIIAESHTATKGRAGVCSTSACLDSSSRDMQTLEVLLPPETIISPFAKGLEDSCVLTRLDTELMKMEERHLY